MAHSLSGTGVTAPETSVAARFSRQVALTPDAVALTDGRATFDYACLAEKAAAVTRLLDRAGVPPGSLVGLSVSRGWHVLAGILGIWGRCCAYVPIDPAYPALRRNLIATDARISHVVTDGEGEDLALAYAEPGGPPHVVPPAAAYVIYTSGSTGRPKGVVVTHDNLTALLDGAAGLLPAYPADAGTVFHSYCFDFSVWEIWRLLTIGARCVYVPAAATLDTGRMVRLLSQDQVSVLNLVPSVFANLVQALGRQAVALPSLREVIFGGEPLNISAVRAWQRLGLAPGARLVNMYGITETTVHVTAKRIDEDALADVRGGETPIGQPLPHLRVMLLGEDGQPATAGRVGEMYVAGAGVSAGYLGQPALTAGRFVRLAADGGARRWYRTGDLARADACGELHFVGRRDNQVQIRGHRIELGEIESVLRSDPEVADSTVIVVPNGRGEPVLMACYVPARTGDGLEQAIRTRLRERLPRYMIPAKLAAIGKLPVTPEGKLNRSALSEMITKKLSTGRPGTGRPSEFSRSTVSAAQLNILVPLSMTSVLYLI